MNKRFLIFSSYLVILGFSYFFAGCQSCSKSGRVQLSLRKALAEASRESVTPQPQTIRANQLPEPERLNDVASDDELNRIQKDLLIQNISPAIGELIQVEGLVFKELNELTIDAGVGSSQIEQIMAIKNIVQSNWHYVFDPAVDTDTWRSAEATIALKYKGKYSGDCDDFAILMASFARQLGLHAVVVGGFNDNNEGHAFALFELSDKQYKEISGYEVDLHRGSADGSYWVSLDWFAGTEHAQFKDLRILVN